MVIDSLAAMISTQQAEKSAEQSTPGGMSQVVGKLVTKTTLALNEAELAGRFPTLIYINQIRYKIGVMYGSPETTPGGQAPLYQSSVRLRVYGKNVMDNKVSTVLPVIKEVNFTLPKNNFVGKLAAAGVAISMDGRGRFMDNIFIERLWRSIKYEEVHLKAYAYGREARAGISSWMTFYNFRRPHQAMNNQTPMAVWRAGMDKIEAAARAVDMPLRLDNANALPTYPQQKQKQQEAA